MSFFKQIKNNIKKYSFYSANILHLNVVKSMNKVDKINIKLKDNQKKQLKLINLDENFLKSDDINKREEQIYNNKTKNSNNGVFNYYYSTMECFWGLCKSNNKFNIIHCNDINNINNLHPKLDVFFEEMNKKYKEPEESKKEYLDLSKMKFSKVINTFKKHRFTNLINLDLSHFTIDRGAFIGYIHLSLNNLKVLNLSNMKGDVFSCFNGFNYFLKNLEILDLSNCTTEYYYFGDLFKYLKNLKELNLSNFKFVKKIEDYSNLLKNVESLETLNLKNIKGCNVTVLLKKNQNHFSNLINLDLSNTPVSLGNDIFINFKNLKHLDLSYINIEFVYLEKTCEIFKDCINLTDLILAGVKGDAISLLYYNKNYLQNLEFLDLSDNKTKCKDLSETISYMDNLKRLIIKNLIIDLPKKIVHCKNGKFSYFKDVNLNCFISNCKNLNYVNMEGFDITGIDIEGLFDNCDNLTNSNIIRDRYSDLDKLVNKIFKNKNK